MRVASQLKKSLTDRNRIFRLNDGGGVADHFTERAPGRTDHRAATSHRLDGRQPKAFVKGWVNETGSSDIESRQIFVTDETERAYFIPTDRLGDSLVNHLGSAPVTSTQSEQPIALS